MHSRTTAREIVDDFAGDRLDYWVTGFGTGGTLKGVARVLRKERPDTKIVVCEPADAPMLTSHVAQERNADGSPSKGHPAWKPHPIQGWSPDFIPKLTADAMEAGVDRIITVAGADAIRSSRELARRKGFSSESAPVRRSSRRSRSASRRSAAQRCCACCRTPASAISARRCSPTRGWT